MLLSVAATYGMLRSFLISLEVFAHEGQGEIFAPRDPVDGDRRRSEYFGVAAEDLNGRDVYSIREPLAIVMEYHIFGRGQRDRYGRGLEDQGFLLYYRGHGNRIFCGGK